MFATGGDVVRITMSQPTDTGEAEVEAKSSAGKESQNSATESSAALEAPDDPDCPEQALVCNGCGGHEDFKCKGVRSSHTALQFQKFSSCSACGQKLPF